MRKTIRAGALGFLLALMMPATGICASADKLESRATLQLSFGGGDRAAHDLKAAFSAGATGIEDRGVYSMARGLDDSRNHVSLLKFEAGTVSAPSVKIAGLDWAALEQISNSLAEGAAPAAQDEGFFSRHWLALSLGAAAVIVVAAVAGSGGHDDLPQSGQTTVISGPSIPEQCTIPFPTGGCILSTLQ